MHGVLLVPTVLVLLVPTVLVMLFAAGGSHGRSSDAQQWTYTAGHKNKSVSTLLLIPTN